jgi:putative methionine-R-sulfoxide reductase with GAF domain
MSPKFDLREVSDRLSASRDVASVVAELLGYLQAERPDWRASLSFYDVSRDCLTESYIRTAEQLIRRELSLAVDSLPPRLVRKFFQPHAFSNGSSRSLLGGLFQAAPWYEPEGSELAALQTLIPVENARSCICLPLADHEDLLALLVVASDKKGAFGGKAADDIVPLKNVAALALARHRYRSGRQSANGEPDGARRSVTEVEDKLRQLSQEATQLEEQNRLKAEQIDALQRELEAMEGNSGQYEGELHEVQLKLEALEEQSAAAAEHLREAQIQVSDTLNRVSDLQRTLRFMKEVLQVLGQEYDGDSFARTIVTWFCEHFHVDRCSLMLYDESKQTLQIGAYRGMDAGVAGKVRVRLGQGISGWVAHHKKPLHVRVKSEPDAPHSHAEVYNSDSFVSVPLLYGNRLAGVLNLSNKQGGVAFTEMDLERATLVGAVLAVILGSHEVVRRGAVAS